jgi:hypothetical protein
MRNLILLCLLTSLIPAAELPPGSYDCIYAQIDGEKHEERLTLATAADGTITLSATGDPMVLTGRVVGTKLYLVWNRIDAQGVHVLQVIAEVGPDGYAAGNAFRSRNAEMSPKVNFILKRIP